MSPNLPLLPVRFSKALRKCCYNDKLFLLDEKLDELTTAELVQDYLLNCGHEELCEKRLELTTYICGRPGSSGVQHTSRRIFATLIIMEEPSLILDVIREGIKDKDLPLLLTHTNDVRWALIQKVNDKIEPPMVFKKWSQSHRRTFYDTQWSVQLPIFREGAGRIQDHPTHRFDNDVIFPWTAYDKVYDGNSEVVRVKIHDSYRRFDNGKDMSYALKSLRTPNVQNSGSEFGREGFLLEVKALLKVRKKKHLEVKLLATYEHDKAYHLLFRWADGGNLMTLWRIHHPRPIANYTWICWLAEQCYGFADGLDGIHNTKMTAQEVQAIQSSLRNPRSTQESAHAVLENPTEEDDGRDFGRHGDIKPENILWFKNEENLYHHGVLKISDFGLTTFHRIMTTMVTPYKVRVTPTYSAPEREVDDKLSRSFDIWSLGCIFLEFVTWILLGIKGVDDFTEKRLSEGGARDQRFSVANFFVVINGGSEAAVKKSVHQWIEHLKKQGSCGQFLREFLDYIEGEMLKVDRHKRPKSRDVSTKLKELFEQCKQDKSYVLSSEA